MGSATLDFGNEAALSVIFFSPLLALTKGQQLSDEFCSAVKSGKTKARCCFKMVFTHTKVDLDSSSVTCTPKNKKIKSLKKLFTGTSGYSFQMTVAVNMGKTGSTIKSAQIEDAPSTTTKTSPGCRNKYHPGHHLYSLIVTPSLCSGHS